MDQGRLKIQLPAAVSALLNRLIKAGFSAYAVGGCVRDSLLGKEPQDWDICTSARPEETQACFASERTLLTGAKYGTVTVIYENSPYEITTFRSEGGYFDQRHPDRVRFLTSLEEDLSRRDFTVNAMAADQDGWVTDCFGGVEDLENRLIRCVGRPEERFQEDPLRMIRGLRFAARLGFSIEEATAAAIHQGKDSLKTVAAERLRKELTGLLCGKAASEILRAFSDVLCVLIPEFQAAIGFKQYNFHHEKDVWEHTLGVVEAIEADEILRLAALFHDIGKPSVFSMDKFLIGHFYGHALVSAAMCEKILRRLRFDHETLQEVVLLVRTHGFCLEVGNEKQLRRLVSRYGEATVRRLFSLRRADAIGQRASQRQWADRKAALCRSMLEKLLGEDACLSLRQLAVNGKDLMALGIPQGPEIGILLQRLLDGVVEGTIQNQREELIQYAQLFASRQEAH